MAVDICVVGAGRIGRIHAVNIAAERGARLRYVVDVDAKAAAALAANTGADAASLDVALGDERVRGVVIASSTDTHLPMIQAAARAGKAVFCEKPLDLDAGNARACIAAAADAGIDLFVGFNRRYDPSFRRLKNEIAAGTVGAVETISITSRDPAPPPLAYIRRSGGLFRDMTIHDFDMARWLLGCEPGWVVATGSCLVDPAIGEAGDIDSASVILQTVHGATCYITNSRRCSYGYDQRIEVFGAAGLVRAGNDTATRVEVATAAGFVREPALPFFLERYREAYRLQMQDFVRALQGESHGLAGGDDGLRALLLAEAAERAARSHQRIALAE